ncbi:MAG: MG2 domain-containing protein [Acidobacteria bacterium]|nr:MG2 domain-containing protein [Acidobacteriota bacterium]
MKLRNHLTLVIVYFTVIASTIALATLRNQVRGAQTAPAAPAAASPQPTPTVRPRFSLSTNRAYGTGEKARIYIGYQGIDSLDFRVYQVKDPFRFFRQLNGRRQLGEDDRGDVAEVAATIERKPSFLEKLRSFKSSVNLAVKNYFRGQLRRESRATFNDKFRSGQQLRLNDADYARMPLLNSDRVTIRGTWRQVLPATENEYDTRMIPLDKLDPGVYLVEAVNSDLRAYTIAVITDMTMINKTTRDGQMLVYVVDRKSGEPRADVQVEVVKGKRTTATGKTDGNGVLKVSVRKDQPAREAAALVPAAPLQEADNTYLVLARRGDQFAVSDLQPSYFEFFEEAMGGEEGLIASDRTASYIYTDRPVYRPDQKVYFKGIVRYLSDSGYQIPAARTASVKISDQNNNEVFNKELPISSRGSFSGEVDLPAGASLGYYSIIATIDGAMARGSFDVAEYKKPEFKVKVTTPKSFTPVGEKTRFTVEAKYFTGAPVSNGDVKYYIYRSRYYHWWFSDEDDDGIGGSEGEEGEGDGEGYYGYGNDMVKEGEGRLNAQGRMEITFDVPLLDEMRPFDFTYRLEAQVTDSSRRMMEGKASFVGTRGKVVVFARPERYVYYQNDNARIKVKATDYEGRPVSSKVALKFVKVTYEKVEERYGDRTYSTYKPVKSELASAEVTTDSQGKASYDYRIPITGPIQIETSVYDNGKRIPSDAGYIYATDRNNRYSDWAYRDYASIKLIPDKKSYQPGETAHVLAMLPADKAHLLVTTEMTSVMSNWRVDAVSRAVMIDVKIEERFIPNVYLSVAYVKDGEMFESSKSVKVPARSKFLNLEIIPDKKEYKPRDPASYTVIARNADGAPAPGVELSLGVVDEAIYSVSPDASGDIRRAFYGPRYNRVETSFSSAFNFTGYSGGKQMDLAANKRSYQLADFKNEEQLVEPKVRKDFKDTAFWKPDVVTGADGKATVKFDLPENLTTWRATARAVTGDLRVGSIVSRVLARKDLILRLEIPRFMTEGDTVTVSGIVHNYLDSDKAAQIKLEVTGANLLDAAQQTVTIAKEGEQRIDWRISASQLGEVTLLATAKTNVESDGIELKLPVVPQGLKQTRAAAAAMAEATSERTFTLDLPANANSLTSALRIEAAPSIAGAMFGALDYLTGYPYGCTEQTMSKFLPNVIVAQALKDVKTATIKAPSDLNKKVQVGLDRLYGFQHSDGGWGWWKDDRTDPFMTAYVVDGLTIARRANYNVDVYKLNRGRERVKQLLDSGKLEDGKPIDPESRAYLVYALNVSGDGPNATDPRYVNDLFTKRADLQPYGRALLALALKHRGDDNRARQVVSELEREARVTEFDAHWESSRRPMLDFSEDNDLEATALSVKALALVNRQSALLPKAARWLVANRRNGYYWDSTKHTAFAIFALSDYLKASGELSADYTVDVYLNGEQVLAKRVTAADAAAGQPMVIAPKGGQIRGSNQVRVVKRGAGVLYASATLDYFTREENVASQSSNDLKLAREYLRLRVSEEGGKPGWKVEPLSGELRSGDLIVARLRLQGARARYLMIEDPIPAGCEQLARVSGIDLDYSDGRWSDWYNNREFRDQRTVIFADYFDGDATFQYALRVQIPGEFKVAPARAELMYQPTVQANTENVKLNILDKK